MQSASRQAVKSCSEAVGLRVVQARSGGRTCRGKNGCRVSRVDFAHGWAKSFTRVATLRFLQAELSKAVVQLVGGRTQAFTTAFGNFRSPVTRPQTLNIEQTVPGKAIAQIDEKNTTLQPVPPSPGPRRRSFRTWPGCNVSARRLHHWTAMQVHAARMAHLSARRCP